MDFQLNHLRISAAKLLWLPCFLALVVVLRPASAARDAVDTVAVMAPLLIESPDMTAFDGLLADAKQTGVNAVSVDVWWGLVEAQGDQQFDWSYYDQVFGMIRAQGLKILPILSFHKCGGGPGDRCGNRQEIPLPAWLWGHFQAQGIGENDLKYESETGRVQDDAIAPWATRHPAVLQQFTELMDSFETHYSGEAGDMVELNVSLGPTGELRYPAYNKSDGWNFPQRGNFQAYSDHAQGDFRQWALARFGGLSGVSNRWGIPLADAAEIRVPGGDLPDDHGARAESFVNENDHRDTQYGRDFVDWYNQSLAGHGKRLLIAADAAFDDSMAAIPLGMKMPGVHWQMQCTATPRIAEVTAGLVATSLNLATDATARTDGYGYSTILDMISDVKGATGREVVLHFTALEMDNDANCGIGTSMAEALVFWVSQGAADRGITHKGENALGCVNDPEPVGSDDNRSWDRVRNAFAHAEYSGFNFLRLSGKNIDGCTPWNPTDKARYQSFIQDFAPSGESVLVHLAEWEMCEESRGCRYSVHTFSGAQGDHPLRYEGAHNGRHWWVGEIPNAPDRFQFVFNNTHSWEGGPGQFDRSYDRAAQGNEIYALGRGDNQVYTARP